MKKELDYYEGFKLCIENALNHIEVAELSKSISFGIAHAHIVLASEEALKATMLFSIHYDMDMLEEFTDFDKYFSDHKHKHENIRNLELTMLFMEKMLSIRLKPFLDSKIKPVSLKEAKRKIKVGTDNQIQWLKDLVDKTKPEVQLKTNDDWWRQAEDHKKKGFYVDILKKQKAWSGPHNCNEEKYNIGKKVAESFISKAKDIEIFFQDEDAKEIYLEMKESKKKSKLKK